MADGNENEAAETFAAILDPARRGALYPHYHRLRALAPIHEDETLLGRRAWILTRFEEADAVLRDLRLHSDTSAIELFDTGASGRTFFEVPFAAAFSINRNVDERAGLS